MDGSETLAARDAVERDARGRFVTGRSGNPAGKRPGTRNRATILAEALHGGEAEGIARIVIDRALSGDAVAARFCLDRLVPRPRGRAIRLPLPEGESAGGDVIAMFNSALRALAAGDITPDEAVTVARFLEGRFRVLQAWALERKVTQSGYKNLPGDDWRPDDTAADDDEAVLPSDAGPAMPVSHTPAGALQKSGEERDGTASPEKPSPACGRGEGEGAAQTFGGCSMNPAMMPSPRPSPASGRGGAMCREAAGDEMEPPLHFTCISRGDAAPGGVPAMPIAKAGAAARHAILADALGPTAYSYPP